MYFCIASSFDIPTLKHSQHYYPSTRSNCSISPSPTHSLSQIHSYGKVEHTRSTDIAVSNRRLLEQRVTSQFVLVAHCLRWMPTTNEFSNFIELLLFYQFYHTHSTSRSDISHSQQTILYFFFNFFFSFISFIRNFNASKCAFNSSKFLLFIFK